MERKWTSQLRILSQVQKLDRFPSWDGEQVREYSDWRESSALRFSVSVTQNRKLVSTEPLAWVQSLLRMTSLLSSWQRCYKWPRNWFNTNKKPVFCSIRYKMSLNERTMRLSCFQHAAGQTAESSHPRALHRVGLWGASESRGAAGTFPPGPAHQEPAGQVQVTQELWVTLDHCVSTQKEYVPSLL